MRKYQATKLKKLTMTKLVMFNKTEIKPCGEVVIKVVNPQNKNKCKVRFAITRDACSPVLGLRAVQGRELITVNTENIATVPQEKENDVLENYEDVFAWEIGKREGKLHLETDKEFTPVKMPYRQWPLTVQQKVKDELDRLEKLGVVDHVDTPTDWISSLVVAVKPNGKNQIMYWSKAFEQSTQKKCVSNTNNRWCISRTWTWRQVFHTPGLEEWVLACRARWRV